MNSNMKTRPLRRRLARCSSLEKQAIIVQRDDPAAASHTHTYAFSIPSVVILPVRRRRRRAASRVVYS